MRCLPEPGIRTWPGPVGFYGGQRICEVFAGASTRKSTVQTLKSQAVPVKE